MPPGHSYIAESTTCSWDEYTALFSEVTGYEAVYRECTLEEFVGVTDDEMFGVEAGRMFEYSGSPGYDGGGEEGGKLLRKEDLWEVSFEAFFPACFSDFIFILGRERTMR